MPGSGKTSVGREVAARLGLEFIDLDARIEAAEGRSVREIFRKDGEAHFRSLELKHLKALLIGTRAGQSINAGDQNPASETTGTAVIALGGGTLTTAECAELVADETFCIFLKASPATLAERLRNEKDPASRPLLAGCLRPETLEARLTELLSAREAAYEKAARLTVETDGLNVDEVAALIAGRLAFQGLR